MNPTHSEALVIKRLARICRVPVGTDAVLADVVRRMPRHKAIGLLYDGAHWDAPKIMAEFGISKAQVLHDVGTARLEVSADEYEPCGSQLSGLVGFSADAVTHAMTCDSCREARDGLRTGKSRIQKLWSDAGVSNVEPQEAAPRVTKLASTTAPIVDADSKPINRIIRNPGPSPERLEDEQERTSRRFSDVRPIALPDRSRRTRATQQESSRKNRGWVLSSLRGVFVAVLVVGIGAPLSGIAFGEKQGNTPPASAEMQESLDSSTMVVLPHTSSFHAQTDESPLPTATSEVSDPSNLSEDDTALDESQELFDPTDPQSYPQFDPDSPTLETWYALAMCESSGNWNADTGNTFYGGLQFTLDSWHHVGGSGYPHHHSAMEQIQRAERLLAEQGWVAWPVCSVKLGLRPPDATTPDHALEALAEIQGTANGEPVENGLENGEAANGENSVTGAEPSEVPVEIEGEETALFDGN